MNITISGGGNIGTQFAVHCAEKGHSVTVFTSNPGRFMKNLEIHDSDGKVIHTGRIKAAVNDPEIAFSDADLIFVTMPAFCMQDNAARIYPYVRRGTIICLTPGSGGGEFFFKPCVDKGCILMGLQRVPSVSRIVEYGHIVCSEGYRDRLYISTIIGNIIAKPDHREADKSFDEVTKTDLNNPGSNEKKIGQSCNSVLRGEIEKRCAGIIEDIFDIPCEVLPVYLNITLTPSNQILHTSRLRAMLNDYREGKVYDRLPLFYGDWDEASSELLLKCDEEVQSICRTITDFDLSGVRSLKEHYGADDVESITKKLKSIKSLKKLITPAKQVDGGVIPDFSSRYFEADFPYGLAVVNEIAKLVGADVPEIRATLEWYEDLTAQVKDVKMTSYHEFSLSKCGIDSYEDLMDFYR